MDTQIYELLIDGKWEIVVLSPKDIQAIKDDLEGILQCQYLVVLDNGEEIDTGIVDDIRLVG